MVLSGLWFYFKVKIIQTHKFVPGQKADIREKQVNEHTYFHNNSQGLFTLQRWLPGKCVADYIWTIWSFPTAHQGHCCSPVWKENDIASLAALLPPGEWAFLSSRLVRTRARFKSCRGGGGTGIPLEEGRKNQE